MRIVRSGSRAAHANFQATISKTGVGWLAYLLKASSQEIVMPSARANRSARIAGVASGIVSMSWVTVALASQGPGASMGTAGHFTQMTMAVLVYGMSALVVGAGLIGAIRRH
jgi:hypothetical protein